MKCENLEKLYEEKCKKLKMAVIIGTSVGTMFGMFLGRNLNPSLNDANKAEKINTFKSNITPLNRSEKKPHRDCNYKLNL